METSKKSTGETLFDLTLYAADTHANRLAKQENEKARTTQDTYGPGLSKPLANYDPSTQSWKMYGDTYLWGDSPLLENLPPSGMTRNGVLFLQPVWVQITGETELSSWPTPTTQDHIERKSTQQKPGSMHSVGLGDAVRMWPTPTTQETEHPDATLTETGRRLSKDGKSSHSLGLADAARMWPTPRSSSAMSEDMETIAKRMKEPSAYKARLEEAVAMEIWPTPTASDWKGRGPNSKQQGLPEIVKKNPYPTMSANGMGNTGSQQMLNKKIAEGSITAEEKRGMTAGNGGKLNPTWVEWLMGFPLGWTDLEDSETP